MANSISKIINATSHRPWPLPQSPWLIWQSWQKLLFAHWRFDYDQVRPLIPEQLELESFDGSVWIGVVPFHLTIRPRCSPLWPRFSKFPEINVRTYVRHGDRSGVWFFSLDASNRMACRLARMTFHLPYNWADMKMACTDTSISYQSSRKNEEAEFVGRYQPVSEVRLAEPGSLEHWLTERYCLYSQSTQGTICVADVHHEQWPLQDETASIESNSMFKPLGLRPESPTQAPILHYAERIDVVGWNLKSIRI